jgi:hypothetical protein
MRSRCSTLLILIILHLLILLPILLLLLRGIRPKDLVDLVDLLRRDGAVTQVLRMRLACASLGKGEAGNELTALPTSTRARMPRLMLYSSAITMGSLLVVLEPPARRLRPATRSPSVLLRLLLRVLSLAMSSSLRSRARASRSSISS